MDDIGTINNGSEIVLCVFGEGRKTEIGFLNPQLVLCLVLTV